MEKKLEEQDNQLYPQVNTHSGRRSVGTVASALLSHYYHGRFNGGWALKRAAARSMMFRL